MVQVYQAISAWQTFSPLRPWLAHSTPEPEPLRAAFRSYLAQVALRGSEPGECFQLSGGKGEKGLPAVAVTLGLTWGVILGFELRIGVFFTATVV